MSADDDIKKVFEDAAKVQPEAAPPGAAPEAGPGGRVRFPDISSRTWEHPADRAALAALRKVPGLDTLLKKVFGFVSEHSLKLLYLANAVEVSPRQFKKVNAVFEDCCNILDVPKKPQLFVAQHPIVNAGAVGIDEPFIVLNSGALDLLDDEELRFVVGHELGHVMSGHALYKTMLHLLLQAVAGRAGLSSLVLSAIIMALREWDRKSELSSDRAGLLCLQNPQVAHRVHMKMAGGGRVEEMDVDAFVAQAELYEKGGDLRDGALRFLNLMGRTHPFAVLRLAELKRWVDGGHYAAVLAGQYPRRSDPAPMYDDVSASVQSYRDAFSESEDPLFKALKDFGNSVSEGSRAIVDQVRDLFGGRKGDKSDKSDKDEGVIRSLALCTLLALPAAAHPLDRFVAAAEGAEVVVLVPRLAHITEPLAASLRRMRQVPALQGALGSEEAVPWGLLDPDFQRKNGIDPQGSFAYAKVAAGPVLRLPVAGPEVVEGLLTTLGRTLTPRADGWQTEEGVAVYREGGIFGAANDAILQPFLSGPAGRSPLAHCPRGPGQADLYVWARAGSGRGCLTVQVDAERLRFEARGEGLPDRWFGDGDATLLARVGAESTTVLGLHLAPAALAKVAGDARVRPITLALDGRVALGAGPALGTATLAFGVGDEPALRAALASQASLLNLVPDGVDTWRITPTKPMEIKGMPKIEAIHLGLRSGALIASTDRAQLDVAPALPGLVAGIERPVVVLANRTGGRPHDGRSLVDALTPVVGSSIEGMRPWIHAAAWLGGHLGAWHVAVTRAGSTARLAGEVELL